MITSSKLPPLGEGENVKFHPENAFAKTQTQSIQFYSEDLFHTSQVTQDWVKPVSQMQWVWQITTYCHQILQHPTISTYHIQIAETMLSKVFVKEALAQENTPWDNIICVSCVRVSVHVCVYLPFWVNYLYIYPFFLYHVSVIKWEKLP